jgi:hypothetical protein
VIDKGVSVMTSPYQPQPAVPQHLQPHLLLRPGQPVHVNRRASWLNATVTGVGSGTVGVHYQSIGAGTPHADAVQPWAVRPADGAQLRAARQIAAGDQIIFGTRIRTVAAPPVDDPSGWLALSFTDGGQRALVMPGAVLRLVDDTPQVTVNGHPLATMLTSMAGYGRG